jgi:prepilin-type N-terminal cleavage/methylation domain-containing protein
MNTSRIRPQFAFTLVELLTVIAIIAVLMGLLFPALQGARDNARRAEAGTMVRNIVNASKAYFNDYGKYPPIAEALEEENSSGGAGAAATAGSYYSFGDLERGAGKAKMSSNEIFDVLRAISRDEGKNKDHVLNPRQQKYFEGKKATDTEQGKTRGGFADGIVFAERQGRLYDPWGTEFFVVLDADGDEEVSLEKFWVDLKGTDGKVRFSAVSFCLGKDLKFGGKGYEGSLRKQGSANEAPDDIVSWQ